MNYRTLGGTGIEAPYCPGTMMFGAGDHSVLELDEDESGPADRRVGWAKGTRFTVPARPEAPTPAVRYPRRSAVTCAGAPR